MQRRVMLSMFVFALMSSFVVANAQEEKKGPGGPGGALHAALAKANLTGEQKVKIKAINEETKEAMKAAREAKDKEAGKKAAHEHMKKVMAVLTEEQREIVKKHLAENRPAKGDKGDKKKPQK